MQPGIKFFHQSFIQELYHGFLQQFHQRFQKISLWDFYLCNQGFSPEISPGIPTWIPQEFHLVIVPKSCSWIPPGILQGNSTWDLTMNSTGDSSNDSNSIFIVISHNRKILTRFLNGLKGITSRFFRGGTTEAKTKKITAISWEFYRRSFRIT